MNRQASLRLEKIADELIKVEARKKGLLERATESAETFFLTNRKPTQGAIAAEMGTSQGYLSEMIKRKRPWDTEMFARFAKAVVALQKTAKP